jgi:hypothetical protein
MPRCALPITSTLTRAFCLWQLDVLYLALQDAGVITRELGGGWVIYDPPLKAYLQQLSSDPTAM